ncbi:2-oxo-4-hydroxy-4-carboxy-5-ureidoimidazoline (OHCU) decarboxylase [hydrothermal vent metagenome]|uniref:2-oxo-4-hydroxy-4-carboxy-5-ureidoimidazoline decarboxylase n=1 Tax=hydrothermal vent metagenome TaxID=652676 RepID=A0A3B0T5I2_9ZZZZ
MADPSRAPFPLPPPLPSTMGREAFVDRFGGIYEHSPWVAEAAHDGGIGAGEDTAPGLAAAMARALEAATGDQKLALIRAHPDLAGKAAVRGGLTPASTSEQTGAGLDQCSAEEFSRFENLNATYRAKFGFPFIFAVGGKTRYDILDAFEARIAQDPDMEFATALEQINKIAALRLMAL